MHVQQHTIDLNREKLDLRSWAAPLRKWGRLIAFGSLMATIVISLVSVLLLGQTVASVLRGFLVSFMFFATISAAALIFVMLQYLTRAGWSVTVRRLAEITSANFDYLAAALAIFLLVGFGLALISSAPADGTMTGNQGIFDVYKWMNPAVVAKDEIIQGKSAFLNVPSFLLRLAVYFAIFYFLSRYFLSKSTQQDASGDPALTSRMQWWAPPGIVGCALSLTFLAFDLVMSLSPHWYSTIFGVYTFAGGMVSLFAVLSIAIWFLQSRGYLKDAITPEHMHDVGKFMFAFVVFWTYIGFAQYMLIWYANIPEATRFFFDRGADNSTFAHWLESKALYDQYKESFGKPLLTMPSSPLWQWGWVSWLLLIGHFVLPFFALISRIPKRRGQMLTIIAVWILVMHWVDMLWLIKPQPGVNLNEWPIHLTDLTWFGLFVGIYAVGVARHLQQHLLVPVRDPWLRESLGFQNY